MGILNILVIILLIVLISIVAILYFGVRIVLKYEKTGLNINGTFKILILEKIAIIKKEFPSPDSSEEESKDSDDEPKKHSKNISKYITILKESKSILRPLFTLIKKSIKAIEVKKLQNHLILGLPSFTDTMEYVGYLWAFFANTNTLIEGCQLSAIPVFGEVKFDGYGEINIKINVIKILPALISFILKKEVRNFIKLILKLHKEASDD